MDKIPNIVNVRFLGNFQLEFNGQTLCDNDSRSNKVWELLAYLIINRNRAVPLAELIEIFVNGENIGNPQNSLKAIVFRVRALLSPIFGESISPIKSSRGFYQWSNDLECVVDIDNFERLCKECSSDEASINDKIIKYKQAIDLYGGNFLIKFEDKLWTVSNSVYLHQLYLSSVINLGHLLIAEGDYKTASDICLRALAIDSLQDEIHMLIVKALMLQGKEQEALSHYEMATEHLYHNLGVKPSETLRNLYLELKKITKNIELDLDVIQDELQEISKLNGAFLCDYGFFKDIYRLESRKSHRDGYSVHVALITIVTANNTIPPLNVLGNVMEALKNSLMSSLRKGDIISKYSGAQFVVMLPNANYENSLMVLQRVKDNFAQDNRKYGKFKIQVSFRALRSL